MTRKFTRKFIAGFTGVVIAFILIFTQGTGILGGEVNAETETYTGSVYIYCSPGASYRIEGYNDDNFEPVTWTWTGDEAEAYKTVDKLKTGYLYRIAETSPPDGYAPLKYTYLIRITGRDGAHGGPPIDFSLDLDPTASEDGSVPADYYSYLRVTKVSDVIARVSWMMDKREQTVNVSGKKIWDDDEDKDGIRPDEITLNLLADGEKIDTVTVSKDNNWEYSVMYLPKYKDAEEESAEPEEITYTITENAVEGYESSVNGFDITNKHEPVEGESSEVEDKSGKIVVSYVDDEDESKLREDIVTEGKVGEEYETEQLTVEGYEFKEVEGEANGFYEAEDKEVVYRYTKTSDDTTSSTVDDDNDKTDDTTSSTVNDDNDKTDDTTASTVSDDSDKSNGAKAKGVKTGDAGSITVCILMLALAAAAFSALMIRRRIVNKQSE